MIGERIGDNKYILIRKRTIYTVHSTHTVHTHSTHTIHSYSRIYMEHISITTLQVQVFQVKAEYARLTYITNQSPFPTFDFHR